MSLSEFRSSLADYARDTKLNLGTILTEEGAPGLSLAQIHGIAMASAYSTRNRALVGALSAELDEHLSDAQWRASKAAATIMGMNNVYYRFLHLIEDDAYQTMPANLRMTVIGNPGVEKLDFELMSLAVSAINGCGMCMKAHVDVAIKAGISAVGIQSTIRIASVINAAAQAEFIG